MYPVSEAFLQVVAVALIRAMEEHMPVPALEKDRVAMVVTTI